MLFKLFKHNTFIEYVSLCIAHKELIIQVNENELLDKLRKKNTPYLKNIVKCNFNPSNYNGKISFPISIYAYLGMYETIASIKLSEVMSNKRKQEVEAHQKLQIVGGMDWWSNQNYYPSYTVTTNSNAAGILTYTANYTYNVGDRVIIAQ